jgi:gamma-glutamyltranspeptidase/glutathione hydrolase
LPFGDLLAPAIEIAERGYAVPIVVQQKWVAAAPLLGALPGWAEAFLPNGRPPEVGERFAFPAAARALKAIAATRGAALYGGEIAAAASAHSRANGGAIEASDFASFKPEWVEPIGIDTYGHRLHEIPPNGQGIAALVALGILRHFDIESLPIDGAESQHLQIEAMKLAFADVYAHVSDSRSMRCTPEEMLDDAYLAGRARLIDTKRAQVFGAGNPAKGGTIYLSAADERGMMVSFIQSNYMGFGAGVVVPAGASRCRTAATASFSIRRARTASRRAASVPHHHPGVPHPRRAAADELRHHGRQHAAAGPPADDRSHARAPPAAAGGVRCAALASQRRQADQRRGDDGEATVAGLVERGHEVAVIQDSYQDFGAGQFIWRLGDPAVEGYVARATRAATARRPASEIPRRESLRVSCRRGPRGRTALPWGRRDGVRFRRSPPRWQRPANASAEPRSLISGGRVTSVQSIERPWT